MTKPYQDYFLMSDIDGTLADSEHRVSRENREAIAHFVAGGGLFAVATGRTQKNIAAYIDGLAINAPCILYNGAALYSLDEKRFLLTKGLTGAGLPDFIERTMGLFPRMNVQVYTQDTLYLVSDLKNIDVHMIREKQEFEPARLADIVGMPWIKVIFCSDHDELQRFQPTLFRSGITEWTNHFFSAPIYLELVGKSVSKGDMLRELKTFDLLNGRKVIAAGDFHNDIEMLRVADLGIAPSSAHADVRAAADLVAVSNDEHLLHHIIHQVIPEYSKE